MTLCKKLISYVNPQEARPQSIIASSPHRASVTKTHPSLSWKKGRSGRPIILINLKGTGLLLESVSKKSFTAPFPTWDFPLLPQALYCKIFHMKISFTCFKLTLFYLPSNELGWAPGLRVNSPRGEAEWAIDRWPLRAKGLIVLVSPN